MNLKNVFSRKEKPLALQLIEENLKTKSPVLDLSKHSLDRTGEYLQLLTKCTHLEFCRQSFL